MKIEVEVVTPALARVYLSRNESNRPLDSDYVQLYKRDIMNGTFDTTHQGILLGRHGILLDGQHRLSAIIAANKSVKLVVARDESKTSVRDLPVDVGRRRSTAYVHEVSKTFGSLANLMLSIINSGFTRSTVSETTQALNVLRPFYDILREATGTIKKGTCRSAIQLGAILRISQNEDIEYVMRQYRAVVLGEFNEFSPMIASFYRQVVVERTAYSSRQLLTRAYKAFDPKNQHLKLLKISNEVDALNDVKEAICLLIQEN